MLGRLIEKSKQFVVTLRFSILSVFVTFFILSMLILVTIIHYRFITSTIQLSFNLMAQASNAAFHQVRHEMENAEIKTDSAAQLVKLGVLDPTNKIVLINYTTNLMQREVNLFPGVQSINWGDQAGTFIAAEQAADHSIHSEIIDRSKNPPTRELIQRRPDGSVINVTSSNDFSFDPRTRPWYQTAMHNKKISWTDIYPYRLTSFLGTSVATPVYNKNGALVGVINLNIRLDYLRNLLEKIHLSEHGILFIVAKNGKIIALPGLIQFNQTTLTDIHQLTSPLWITESFDTYQKNKKQEFIFKHNGRDYLARFSPLPEFGNHEWLIGAAAPVTDFTQELWHAHFITLIIILIILIVGVTAVSILTSRIIRPLKKITREIRRIRNFNLDNTRRITSRIREINYIGEALFSMKKGLRTFQRYVPAGLVRQLIETGADAQIGGTKKMLAILFSDIKDFTTIAEKVDPEELTPHVCEYLEELSHIIVLNNGTIDKYIGDAIMAFWGAPIEMDNPYLSAAKAALRCIKRSNELNMQWQKNNKPVFYTRMGIHLGEAIVGNIGSSDRLNYTAIGDAINIASRLESINKIYHMQIIVSEAMYNATKDHFALRFVDQVSVKGKHEINHLYELIAETRTEVPYDLENYSQLFKQGFQAYQQGQWDEAIRFFKECLVVYMDDTLAPVFMTRCEHFKATPPDNTWNGIWHMAEK